ncbi:Nif3-like dinuclear metal center hexameric protein [uncultured Oscillibacter sp.]|uniref:Nif3-like dinuclear metal center hexameric protein n=1 Tax=uncultured Oscillibacter sp. TaxID=876091 RepID=UPI00261C6F65|nr:Nif3-like dinuclear metal center hexameric protein [uncultured Oscillibacter sp.]
MPTVGEIEQALFELAPRECAQDWDNVGFLVGRRDREVRKVLVALDITEDVIEEAVRWGADLIVSHHPVIFHGQKSVTDRDVTGGRVLRLIEGGLSAICMHTNLDCAEGGVNDVLARALGIEKPEGFTSVGVGRCGCLEEPRVLPEFVRFVSKTLDCNGVRYAGAGKPVYRVAVGGGACGEFQDAAIYAGCDTFVTADLSYHQFVDAKAKGINLIDAGHFPTEDLVCGPVMAFLKKRFPNLSVQKSASHKEAIQYYVEGE